MDVPPIDDADRANPHWTIGYVLAEAECPLHYRASGIRVTKAELWRAVETIAATIRTYQRLNQEAYNGAELEHLPRADRQPRAGPGEQLS